MPAERQITAEQIVRESLAFQEEDFKAPKRKIADLEELKEYQLGKRKEFEDLVRRVGRWNGGIYVKYAAWEESQNDFRRARSVWERAIESDYRNATTWLKYADMEMRHKFVNHARNVWDRAVTYLPRVDQLWYKFIHMEEMLGQVQNARQIFERWMKWEPDHNGWRTFTKFEMRYGEVERARSVLERYVICLPTDSAWMYYAKAEAKQGERQRARQVYERAVEVLSEDAEEELYIAFAVFEEHCGEHERARAVYEFALSRLPRHRAENLYKSFVDFEKCRGDRGSVEDAVAGKRRLAYEAAVAEDPLDYDSWFDFARLEEQTGDAGRVREVYERAVANVPPGLEKRFWGRYIYLWINYALYEELEAEDPDNAREVYRACLKLIPHQQFTFAKVWLFASQLEVRKRRLDAARKILGTAIGMCPKAKLFRGYIEMELQLGNVDRCRALYSKCLEWDPSDVQAWTKFAELERSLGEDERCRGVYELAVSQPELDKPETVWKSYIDSEIANGNRSAARALYERLLERTRHVKVWASLAAFEATPLPSPEADEGDECPPEDPQESPAARAAAARAAYERGFKWMREEAPHYKEDAVALLEAWRIFESSPFGGGASAVSAVDAKMPCRVKRQRELYDAAGNQAGHEEYFDYVFPEEGGDAGRSLKILEAAYAWKMKMQGGGGSAAEGEAPAAPFPDAADAEDEEIELDD